MKKFDQDINHNVVNHILAGETRFTIHKEKVETQNTKKYKISYNWGTDPKIPESNHGANPEK